MARSKFHEVTAAEIAGYVVIKCSCGMYSSIADKTLLVEWDHNGRTWYAAGSMYKGPFVTLTPFTVRYLEANEEE